MKRTNLVASLSLHAALFKDMTAYDQDLQHASILDLQRMEALTETRGLTFIMIDLPEAGKVVDFALSRSYIDWSTLPKSFGKAKPYPKFLGGLFSRVFREDGTLYPNVDINHVYFLRQILYLCKKVREECSDAAILAEVDAYREIDQELKTPSLHWDLDLLYGGTLGYYRTGKHRVSFLDGYKDSPDLISHRDECPQALLRILQAVSDRVICRYPEFDWRELKPRHGPGAVADAKSGTDKYLFPSWPRKLDGIFPYQFFGQSREDLHHEVEPSMSLHEPPAKLFAVPKTLKAPRMIASEPVAHQYIQLGMMRWLRLHLPKSLHCSIDFFNQGPSREACLEASKHGEVATVDLSAASDRLSCWVVERIFRTNPSLLEALHACRTRWLRNATNIGEPYFLVLKKYAPMGNGTTFPVQSIVYTIISIAALLYEEGSKVNQVNIAKAARHLRVFGDDIILPSPAVPALALLLRHLQLKVNIMKTHYVGHFRESCGQDSYKGVDVTPLYLSALELDETADALVSWVDVCNNAYTQGLWHLSDAMRRQIPIKVQRLIPFTRVKRYDHDKGTGCLSFCCHGAIPPMKTRVNPDLHRDEVLGLTLQGGSRRHGRDSYQSLLQFFVEDPSPDLDWRSGYDTSNKRLRLRKRWVPML